MIRHILSISALAALVACSSSAPIFRPAPPPAERPTTPQTNPPAEQPAADPRTQTLDTMLLNARDERLAGNLLQAEATVEAALRIAPDDARLWLELAETRLATGDYEAAASFANRAISLAGGNSQVRENALRIRDLSAR